MRALLQKLNVLPFGLTIRHYYPLEGSSTGRRIVDLTQAAGWDLMRAEEGHLYIPDGDRERWVSLCEGPVFHDSNGGDLPARASDIIATLHKRNLIGEIYSLGVGLGALEFHLKRLQPNLKVYCSDYGLETARRLRGLFTECDGIDTFDINTQTFCELYPKAARDAVVLIHRVDPHLTDAEWKRAFAALAVDGVRYVFFIPHRVLTLRYLVESKKREVIHKFKGTPMALSGYVRSFERWRALWGDAYNLIETGDVGYARGFWLEARSGCGA